MGPMKGTPAQLHGKTLYKKLLEQLKETSHYDPPFDDSQFDDTINHWKNKSSFLGRNNCLSTERPCAKDPALCSGRCQLDYWIEHGEITGKMMSLLAERIDADTVLFYQVGRLHDIDYLSHPHDTGEADRACHPVPLVQYLREKSFSVRACIAILEHAPYLGLGRYDETTTRQLSLSLSVAEDAATLYATKRYSEFRKNLPPLIRDLLVRTGEPKHLVDISIDRGRYSQIPDRVSNVYAALKQANFSLED